MNLIKTFCLNAFTVKKKIFYNRGYSVTKRTEKKWDEGDENEGKGQKLPQKVTVKEENCRKENLPCTRYCSFF